MKKKINLIGVKLFASYQLFILFSLYFARRSFTAVAKALAVEERRRAVVDDANVQRVMITA